MSLFDWTIFVTPLELEGDAYPRDVISQVIPLAEMMPRAVGPLSRRVRGAMSSYDGWVARNCMTKTSTSS